MLDSIDLQLLNLLQRDASRTAESLSEEVALSPSAISRRVRRMQTNGLIDRTIAIIAPKLSNDRNSALIIVQWSKGSSRTDRDRKLASLKRLDAVQLLIEVSGQFDMVLLVNCASMLELSEFINDHLENELIERHETHFVMRTDKFAPFVQLGLDIA